MRFKNNIALAVLVGLSYNNNLSAQIVHEIELNNQKTEQKWSMTTALDEYNKKIKQKNDRKLKGYDIENVIGFRENDPFPGNVEIIGKVVSISRVTVKDRIGYVQNYELILIKNELDDKSILNWIELVVVGGKKHIKVKQLNTYKLVDYDPSGYFKINKKYLFISNRSGSEMFHYNTVENYPNIRLMGWKSYTNGFNNYYIINGPIIELIRSNGKIERNW